MLEITTTRDNPGVDPILHVWGWEIPVYLFVGGMVAGMMILAGIAMMRIARGEDPKGYADKCTFCDHRVKEGKNPACVSVCPTHCMHFGDLDDPKSAVSGLLRSRKWHTLLPEAGTRPRVFYLT